MPNAHKIISAILRVFEFCMSAVNLGILARFFQLVDETNIKEDPVWTYALAQAAISLCFAILLLPPVGYSFWAFPIDFVMFVMWIVEFALVENLAGVNTCHSHWFDDHWIIYWGDVAVLGGSACSRLRVIIAFSFIVGMTWFFSGLLGIYTTVEYYGLGAKIHKAFGGKKKKHDDLHDDLEKNGTDTAKLHKNGATPAAAEPAPAAAPAAPQV